MGTKFATLSTERMDPGEVVPMPMKPDCITLKRFPVAPTNKVEVAIKAFEVVVPVIWALPAWMERSEPGEVVPIPVNPF